MENQFSLINKRILITGASSGIGKECAIACSKMGARLVLIGRNVIRLKETLGLLEGSGHYFFSLDLTKTNQIEPEIDTLLNQTGQISGFIHCAGFEITKPLNCLKTEDYISLFTTNVIAGFELARIVCKKKNAAEKLSLVFISSVVALKGQVALTAYGASKGALISGVRSMAVELAAKNIRVNCISPGWILGTAITETDDEEITAIRKLQYPLGFGDVSDVANASIYLLSDAAKWVTGSNLIVDGGYTAK